MELVAEHYPVEPLVATLVRSSVNDVYRIETDTGPHALKIYGAGRFSVDEVRWEQQLARHLVDCDVPVAGSVGLREGDCVGVLQAPEGARPFALTAWLPGTKPSPPWTEGLYRAVGGALARLHIAADSSRADTRDARSARVASPNR